MTCNELLIFESGATGCRLAHLELILHRLSDTSVRTVTLVAPSPDEARAFARLKGCFPGRLDVDDLAGIEAPQMFRARPKSCHGPVLSLIQQLRQSAKLRRYLTLHGGPERFDFVLLPTADRYIWGLAMTPRPFHGIPWSAITYETMFHSRAVGYGTPRRLSHYYQPLIFRHLLADPTLVRVFVEDNFLCDYVNHQKLSFLPHGFTVVDRPAAQDARRHFALADDKVAMLAYGAINSYKQIGFLISSLQQAPGNTVALLVGRQSEDVRPSLETPEAKALIANDRLKILDVYADAELEARSFMAADIVWAVYSKERTQTSGVVAQAGHFAKPVITGCEGWMGKVVGTRDLGEVLKARTVAAAAQAIANLATNPARRGRCGRNGWLTFSSYTPDSFASRIVETITRTLADQPPLRGPIAVPKRSDSGLMA